MRAKPSTGGAKRGTLDKGEMVRITEIRNGWGCFYYNGKEAYISLDYADFTAPITYRVIYDADGGKNAPTGEVFWSMEQVAVDAQIPTKEGFLFLWWEDAAGRSYAAGEALPTGDVTLTAVWQAVPVSEPQQPSDTDVTPDAEDNADELLTSDPESDNDGEIVITPETGRENRAPAIAAGVVVGMLTVGFIVLWVKKKIEDR